jgi:hypothetical protein
MEQRDRRHTVRAPRPRPATPSAAGLPAPEISALRPGISQPQTWRDCASRRQVWLAGRPAVGGGRHSSCISSCQIAARTVSWKGRAGRRRRARHARLRTRPQPAASDLWQLDPGGSPSAGHQTRGGLWGRCAPPPPAAATQADAALAGAQQEPAAGSAPRQSGQSIQVHHAAVHGRDGVAHRAA